MSITKEQSREQRVHDLYLSKVRELIQYSSNHWYNKTVWMFNHIKDDEVSDDLQTYTIELDTSEVEWLQDSSYYRINITELLFNHDFIEVFTKGNIQQMMPIILPSRTQTQLVTDKDEMVNWPERRLVLQQMVLFPKIEDRVEYFYTRYTYILDRYFWRVRNVSE
jgi:hypothetical protein